MGNAGLNSAWTWFIFKFFVWERHDQGLVNELAHKASFVNFMYFFSVIFLHIHVTCIVTNL